jgi:threonine dehydrogenase-like Zn-dependent dehydrogenase
MRAVLLSDQLRLASDAPMPEPHSDQALIKVRRAGICNTDLELVKGYMGFSGILGHEFVGEVVAGADDLIGRRVVGEINVACGACDFCASGIPSQCRKRTTIGIDRHPGAFADYLALTRRNLHVVPDGVSDDQAVFVEPLAAALQVYEAAHLSPRDRVVVIGAGKLGMLVAQVVRLIGCDLAVIARSERKARLLKGWGIDTVERVTPREASVVIDCTGTAEGFALSLDAVKPRGTILLKSTYVGLPQADLTRVVVDEIRVIGTRCGSFSAALRLLSMGVVDVKSLIERRYSLDDALTAFDAAAQPGMLKVLLEM